MTLHDADLMGALGLNDICIGKVRPIEVTLCSLLADRYDAVTVPSREVGSCVLSAYRYTFTIKGVDLTLPTDCKMMFLGTT